MNRKEIRQVITKLRIGNGNIIVIRGDPTDVATTAYADEFVYQLQQSHLKDVFVVVLDDPSKIAVYDITTMNKAMSDQSGLLVSQVIHQLVERGCVIAQAGLTDMFITKFSAHPVWQKQVCLKA